MIIMETGKTIAIKKIPEGATHHLGTHLGTQFYKLHDTIAGAWVEITDTSKVDGIIDWSQAPEWANKYGTVGSENRPVFYDEVQYQYLSGCQSHHPFTFDIDHPASAFTLISKRPLEPEDFGVVKDETPTYTKEMHERGELPPVDSNALTSFGEGLCLCHCMTLEGERALIQLPNAALIMSVDEVLPLEPIKIKSNKQKLIDSLVNELNKSTGKSTVEVIADLIISGKFENVKWMG